MHAMSICIAHEQFIRHPTVERMQARSEDFHTRVMRALLHTHVFMKFKSSCTVLITNKCVYQLIVSVIVQNGGSTLDHGNNGLGHWSVSDCIVGRFRQNIVL